MDTEGNILPANPIYGTRRKSYRKREQDREREGNKKDLESVKGKKRVLTKPSVFSNKTLTSL